MNAQQIKEWIVENQKVEEVLENLNCQHIKYHNSGYFTCGNPPPSDNPTAITVYVPSLNIVNYTKDIPKPSDLISLTEFIREENFFHALKYLHQILGLDFYKDEREDIPLSLIITKDLQRIQKGERNYDEDDTPIKPIPESVLKYYRTPCVNDMFLRDGISYKTQFEFSIGYCEESNRITIPVYDEINNLVSVKGRLFKETIEEDELKYIYLYKCPKNKILFGLNKTYSFIKEENFCFITESEKGVMQLWSGGYKNSVGLGGKNISKGQIEKLTRLNVPLYFVLDEDVKLIELQNISDGFVQGTKVFALYNDEGLLKDKQSPTDNLEIFKYMLNNNVIALK